VQPPYPPHHLDLRLVTPSVAKASDYLLSTSCASTSTLLWLAVFIYLLLNLFRKLFPDIIANWHFSGPCGNLNYLGHSKKFWLIDWLIDWLNRTESTQIKTKEREKQYTQRSAQRDANTACAGCPPAHPPAVTNPDRTDYNTVRSVIKHHTLICAQETDNVIYSITEFAR